MGEVVLIRSKHEYQGLSTDDKPTSAPDGATYHSFDTGEQWVMANKVWMPDLRLSYATIPK